MGDYYKDGKPNWTVTGEFPFTAVLPAEGEDLHEITDAIGAASGMEGPFASWRPRNANRLHVSPFHFLDGRRLTYYPDQGKVVADEKRFRWDHFFTSLHARGGYHHYSFLHDLWAF